MKKSTIIILLLLLSVFFSHKAISDHVNEEIEVCQTKNMIAVNVTLSNGTVLSFKTIDDYLLTIYDLFKKGEITLQDVEDVKVLNWNKYITLYNTSEELNESAYSKAYSLYFYWIDNASIYNYSGHIVAGALQDFINAGIRYEGIVIYGKVHSITLKAKDGEISKDELGSLSILIIGNFSDNNLLSTIYGMINESKEISFYLVDVSNKLNVTELPSNAKIIGLEDSKLNGDNLTESIGLSNIYPVIIGIYNTMIVWKSVGIDSIKRSIDYLIDVNTFGNENFYRIAGYKVDRILGYNLFETKIAKITVFFSKGIGEANVSLEYIILDKENNTIKKGHLLKEVNNTEPVTFEIELKNGSRFLKINVSVVSDFGSDFEKAEFKVESIYKEKPKPKIPWATIISILLVIIVFIAGVVYYRKKY